MRKKIISTIVCILIIATAIPVISSQNNTVLPKIPFNMNHPCSKADWLQLQKLFISDGRRWDNFGSSLSVSGNTALIGAWGRNYDTGAAYVYTRSGSSWSQQATLTASDGAEEDYFGCSVYVSGNTALIGAYYCNSCKGAVYVFTRSGSNWTQQAKLTASDGVANDAFGWSVALSGDTAFIGAQNCNSFKGAAYVFTRSGSSWTQQAKLTAAGGEGGEFGYSVYVSGDTALIGAYTWDDWKGAAYVFTRSGSNWSQQAKLLASDGLIGDAFGVSVYVSGDNALIGAPGCNNWRGAVYEYTRSGSNWTQQAKLNVSDSEVADAFGVSLSVSGETVLIGAYGYDSYMGAAYVFTQSGSNWTLQTKLNASDGTVGDKFGWAVSLSDDTAFIGAFNWNNATGKSYIFINEQPPTPPTISGSTRGKANQPYNYSFNATDPNGDNVSYFIDWGDNTNSSWIVPYSSGVTVTKSHTWTKKGTYIIKAKAKDIHVAESNWSTMSVTMPLSYEPQSHPFLTWLLQRFPHAFPLLRYLLNRS